MNVFLTGSTGYVGGQILQDLLAQDHHVRCLVRAESRGKLQERPGVETVVGDIVEPKTLQGKLDGCDAAIHLVGIIREFPREGITWERIHWQGARNVIDEAERAGAKRFLLMSAMGVRADGVSQYQTTKYRAEEYLKQSSLEWTIFRPSLIFGERDQSVNTFAKIVKLAPFYPIFGRTGESRFQPVAVENVAEGFVKALNASASIGKTYEVGGSGIYTFRELIQIIGGVLGKRRVRTITIPMPLIMLQARLFQYVKLFGRPLLPFSVDQLKMLSEDNVGNSEPFFRELGIQPIGFKEGIARYMR